MSTKSHPLNHDVISSSLERLYVARPSHTRPFHARTHSLIQAFDICELPLQSANHFLIPPWTILPYHFITPFMLLIRPMLHPAFSINSFLNIVINILNTYLFLLTGQNLLDMLAVVSSSLCVRTSIAIKSQIYLLRLYY